MNNETGKNKNNRKLQKKHRRNIKETTKKLETKRMM